MNISWNSLRVSIAGAKLSHLVQEDKIWDHGSMLEQVKMIFFKLKKAKANGNIQDLRKYVTVSCYEALQKEINQLNDSGKKWIIKNELIKEIAVIEVGRRKNNKPDCFTALIKSIGIQFISDKHVAQELINYSDQVRNFSEQWSFIRQGDWWVLDKIRSAHSLF
jgi:predicted lipid-binding transport protein (Tim44 family)